MITPNAQINTIVACSKPSPHYAPERPRKEKQIAIEYLRIFAAFGIIVFHCNGSIFSLSGLICFVIISSAFVRPYKDLNDLKQFIKKKAARLLLPWAFWYGVYLVLKIAIGRHVLTLLAGQTYAAALFTGPHLPLWYLPFTFLTTTISCVVLNASMQLKTEWKVVIYTLASVSLLLFSAFLRNRMILFPPIEQWVHAMAAVPIGLIFAAQHDDKKQFLLNAFSLPLLVLTGCCIAYFNKVIAISYIPAILVTFLAFQIHTRRLANPALLSSACLGAYLTHGIILFLLNKIQYLASSVILLPLSVIILSFATAIILLRIPIIKRAL